jgi:hypothetical protein
MLFLTPFDLLQDIPELLLWGWAAAILIPNYFALAILCISLNVFLDIQGWFLPLVSFFLSFLFIVLTALDSF